MNIYWVGSCRDTGHVETVGGSLPTIQSLELRNPPGEADDFPLSYKCWKTGGKKNQALVKQRERRRGNQASSYQDVYTELPSSSSDPAEQEPDLEAQDQERDREELKVLTRKMLSKSGQQASDDVFSLWETKGYFPSSFYYSYTTLIPKGLLRNPLSLRPITVLPVPYRIYASLRCQTLLKWQNSWVHPSQFAFCKGRSTTSLNSHLCFDLLQRFHSSGSFAGIQFDFAKCFDSIPYSVIWDTLSYHGCDANFILLLRHLYTHMHRCFRYAGCIGSFWHATNGLLQGDPLSVVILNCVLCPLLRQLSIIPGLSVYAFADDLTVVSSSSWDTLYQAYQSLTHFCDCTDLTLNTSKCQLWNKGTPTGDYPPSFDQLCYRFYPFLLLGSPIDVGVPYSDAIQQHGDTTVSRARKISKLPLPYRLTYRLFVSLVSSCYNHFALSCDIIPSHLDSLKHAVTYILVPK